MRFISIMKKHLNYYHTIKYLRMNQWWHFFRARITPPKLDISIVNQPSNSQLLMLKPCLPRNKIYFDHGCFFFLNRKGDLGFPVDWQARSQSLLWRYNLHYFDFLHQNDFERPDGLRLMQSWVEGNPVNKNNAGWQPYPLSLRLVNWIKFFSLKNIYPSSDLLESIALQAKNLQRQIEYHLQGNHLMANGKALWFAGAFLNSDELSNIGRDIFLQELPKQFLKDGGTSNFLQCIIPRFWKTSWIS